MARVIADDHDATVATNNLALVADLLDGRADFHGLNGLFLSEYDAPLGKVVGREFDEYGIPLDNVDEMLAHFPGDIGLDGVAAEVLRDLDFENGSGEGLHYDPLHLYLVFFRHGIGVGLRTDRT